jgi:hypothetical protein
VLKASEIKLGAMPILLAIKLSINAWYCASKYHQYYTRGNTYDMAKVRDLLGWGNCKNIYINIR